MMTYTNGDDTPPLTIERLMESVREAQRAHSLDLLAEWVATLDRIPYAVSGFITSDKAIWMKETKYYHAFIVFPTEADAQEMSRVTGKPLINVRDLPVKEWWQEMPLTIKYE